MSEPTEEMLAYHEAGHAVLAFVLGYTDVRPSIIKNVVSYGRSPYRPCPSEVPDSESDRSRALIQVIKKTIISQAGHLAQTRNGFSKPSPEEIEIDLKIADAGFSEQVQHLLN